MVAGDTKKIIVIKNISSNLIEEAIIILKNEPGTQELDQQEKPVQKKLDARNDFILKEAESIINQYIKDNGLTKVQSRGYRKSRIFPRINISNNALINILFLAAIAFLILVVGRVF